MTRPTNPGPPLADALTAFQLRFAPELTTLLLLEQALAASCFALRARYADLDDFATRGESPPLLHARRLLLTADLLHRQLRRYRNAVVSSCSSVLGPHKPDPIPF